MIRFRLVVALLALVLGAVAIAVIPAGCGSPVRAAVGEWVPAPPPPAEAPPKDRAEVDERLAAAEHRRDDAELEVRQLRAARDRLADEAARTRLAWGAGILAAAAIAFVVVAFIVPAGKGWAATAAIGCGMGAATALALRAAYAWLPWVGAAAGLAFALYVVWQLVLHKRAGREAARPFDLLEQALQDWTTGKTPPGVRDLNDLLSAVKAEASRSQAKAKVGRVVAGMRGKPYKPPVATPA